MIRILEGDCRTRLADLAPGSVHAVCTSPPYFGLRDYGADGQIGLEATLDDYLGALVGVFRAIRRVLRDDGTAWLNLGDSYAASATSNHGRGKAAPAWNGHGEEQRPSGWENPPRRAAAAPFKPGDLMMVPHRAAMALQQDGWWIRQDNVWAKRNCMPESIDDRTTRAHEYVFQMTKSGDPLFWTHRDQAGTRTRPAPDYRWINRDTKEELAFAPIDNDGPVDRTLWRRINLWEGHPYFYDQEAIAEDGDIAAGTRAAKGGNVRGELKDVNGRPPEYWNYTGRRNKRSVWWLATMPFPDAHFATMPPDLAAICIQAGTSERGCCPACGAGWARVTEQRDTGRTQKMPDGMASYAGAHGTIHRDGREKGKAGNPVMAAVTTGWRPTCGCPAADPIPATVLDPFAGAGTTLLVADRLQRDAVGIELKGDYCAMIRRRIGADAPLLSAVAD